MQVTGATFLRAASVFVAVSLVTSIAGTDEKDEGRRHLKILSAEIDQAAGRILIKGHNLVSHHQDTVEVSLAGDPLLVIGTPTPTEVVAELPAGYPPGTYLLTVSRGHGRRKSDGSGRADELNLAVGAVGPVGPPGQQGEQGPPGSPGLGCQPGDFLGCYTGPPATKDIGLCKPGVRTCVGGVFGNCEGEVLPAAEIPDNSHDENCDGVEDHSPPATPEPCDLVNPANPPTTPPNPCLGVCVPADPEPLCAADQHAGTGTQGNACGDGGNDCAQGYFCVQAVTGQGQCARWCRVATPECPAGLFCTSFTAPYVSGGVEYGVCY
jgi:hypothetical protein